MILLRDGGDLPAFHLIVAFPLIHTELTAKILLKNIGILDVQHQIRVVAGNTVRQQFITYPITVVGLICRSEEKLKATMTDEQKELFEKYTNCVREHQTNTDCLIFQNDFKLGARMMLAAMEE